MLKIKNQGFILKILLLLFFIVAVVFVLTYKNVIDLVYFGILFLLFFMFLLEKYVK